MPRPRDENREDCIVPLAAGRCRDLVQLKTPAWWIKSFSRSDSSLLEQLTDSFYEEVVSKLRYDELSFVLDKFLADMGTKTKQEPNNAVAIAFYLFLKLFKMFCHIERAQESESKRYQSKSIHFIGYLRSLANHNNDDKLPEKRRGYYHADFKSFHSEVDSLLHEIDASVVWKMVDSALILFFGVVKNEKNSYEKENRWRDHAERAITKFYEREHVVRMAALLGSVHRVYQEAYVGSKASLPTLPTTLTRTKYVPPTSESLKRRQSKESSTDTSSETNSDTSSNGSFFGILARLSAGSPARKNSRENSLPIAEFVTAIPVATATIVANLPDKNPSDNIAQRNWPAGVSRWVQFMATPFRRPVEEEYRDPYADASAPPLISVKA
jgi:hypothetical protein